MNYKILADREADLLAEQVNEAIADGFMPVGGVAFFHPNGLVAYWFCQAVYKPERKKRTVTKIKTPECPPGVSQHVWDDFLAHRADKKKPLTATSYARICKDFGEWTHEKNVDLNAILLASIRNGWTGVFRPKEEHKSETAEKLQYVRDDDLSTWAQRVGAPAPKAMGGYDYRMYRADLARWLERQ